jgi:hypothetical protein
MTREEAEKQINDVMAMVRRQAALVRFETVWPPEVRKAMLRRAVYWCQSLAIAHRLTINTDMPNELLGGPPDYNKDDFEAAADSDLAVEIDAMTREAAQAKAAEFVEEVRKSDGWPARPTREVLDGVEHVQAVKAHQEAAQRADLYGMVKGLVAQVTELRDGAVAGHAERTAWQKKVEALLTDATGGSYLATLDLKISSHHRFVEARMNDIRAEANQNHQNLAAAIEHIGQMIVKRDARKPAIEPDIMGYTPTPGAVSSSLIDAAFARVTTLERRIGELARGGQHMAEAGQVLNRRADTLQQQVDELKDWKGAMVNEQMQLARRISRLEGSR